MNSDNNLNIYSTDVSVINDNTPVWYAIRIYCNAIIDLLAHTEHFPHNRTIYVWCTQYVIPFLENIDNKTDQDKNTLRMIVAGAYNIIFNYINSDGNDVYNDNNNIIIN